MPDHEDTYTEAIDACCRLLEGLLGYPPLNGKAYQAGFEAAIRLGIKRLEGLRNAKGAKNG